MNRSRPKSGMNDDPPGFIEIGAGKYTAHA
jgi:hypothetical protein